MYIVQCTLYNVHCTYGVPAMLGSKSGFTTLVKHKNPEFTIIHCTIHRVALTSKTLTIGM